MHTFYNCDYVINRNAGVSVEICLKVCDYLFEMFAVIYLKIQ